MTHYYFVLQGNKLTQHAAASPSAPVENTTVFENRQWTVTALQKDFGINVKGPQKELELYCGDKETQEAWLSRLRRVCMNEATHGIEIQSQMIDYEITQEYFMKEVIKGKEIGEKEWLEVSVWDFAGQQDYYNNHHYFISTRTVFLVLWKMSEGDEVGMKGLDFWFRSLATHLASSSPHHHNQVTPPQLLIIPLWWWEPS